MLYIHGTTKVVQRGLVLWSTLCTKFCLMFLKINMDTIYAFMGGTCYLEKVKLSTYTGDRNSHLLKD
jgi:hypothetical protein